MISINIEHNIVIMCKNYNNMQNERNVNCSCIKYEEKNEVTI
jgi:hypothetical protein